MILPWNHQANFNQAPPFIRVAKMRQSRLKKTFGWKIRESLCEMSYLTLFIVSE